MDATEPKNSTALISIAAVVVIIYGMQAAKVLLVPFLLAVFLALITVRPMLWMQRRRVPSVFAALLIVIAAESSAHRSRNSRPRCLPTRPGSRPAWNAR